VLHPVRTSAGWLTGRLFLLLLILAVLVVVDAYRAESTLLGARLRGLVPDRELLERLERGREVLVGVANEREREVNERLRALSGQSAGKLDARVDSLQEDIEMRERLRRSTTRRTIALLTGEGFQEDLENDIELQLLVAERDVLLRLRDELDARAALLHDARSELLRTARRTQDAWARYREARAALERLEQEHPIWSRLPGTEEWARSTELARESSRLAREYSARGEEFYAARDRWQEARSLRPQDVAQVRSASAAILEPLDDLVATRRGSLESAEREGRRIQRSVRRVFAQALWILVAVTLAPVAVKAFWYSVLAPLVARRPPIRVRSAVSAPLPEDPSAESGAERTVAGPSPREKISSVSLDVVLRDGEELLVHPEFLQSSPERARKSTRWLLSGSYPVTSLAAGMVALTRARGEPGERFVVSSRNDPLVEVALLTLGDDEALVLQPRSLVGVVQRTDRPVRLSHRWIFSLSALITLQFRYLVFDGPGRLLVQGCRGVRIEPAGTGRSIDQNATLGFSAQLDYGPRRSETFGAYLLGVNGLFNDTFAGGPGYCVYEEMPYLGRRTGITGRGLEGATDGLLKVFGI